MIDKWRVGGFRNMDRGWEIQYFSGRPEQMNPDTWLFYVYIKMNVRTCLFLLRDNVYDNIHAHYIQT